MNFFAKQIIDWQINHGRQHLPWQNNRSAYRVWISEVMLQQTQVETVIPYFNQWLTEFPTLYHLANATEDQVLGLWSGLGYYSRARNLLKTARIIQADYQGIFPSTTEEIQKLPGIGRSTAGAILSLGLNQSAPILDGNVKRIFSRYFGIEGSTNLSHIQKKLWEKAQALIPTQQCTQYNQGLMDLGSLICTRKSPNCTKCPIANECIANINGLQHNLPTPNIKTKKTRKQLFWLIAQSQTEIWLNKRPEKGIWAGLYQGFEFNSVEELNQKAKSFSTENPIFHQSIRHELTHLSLTIELYSLKTSKEQLLSESGFWYNFKNKPYEIGMPRPLSRWLNEFNLPL
jgi:A/G-specific adenine glycosylase